MKRQYFYLMLISTLLTSCATTIHEIGSIGMLSDKKIDANTKYQKLASNVGSTKKEIRKTDADNIEAAINQVLAKVPGAEYLTNVKIYAVNGDFLAVSGDVWGEKKVFVKQDSSTPDTKALCKK
jgi:hypothetical protein